MMRGTPPFDEIARWNISGANRGVDQMARDEVMLRLAGGPVLRIYRWIDREVTFGYPQRWEDARAYAGARPLTRRCTGGGMVEHGDDVTVAIAVPSAHPFCRLAPAESYRRIHEAIRDALSETRLDLARDENCLNGPACFASPARSDVLLGERKVAGGAQRRSRNGLLYQGSIQGIRIQEDFEERLGEALSQSVTEWKPIGWKELEDELVATRYGTAEWNQKR